LVWIVKEYRAIAGIPFNEEFDGRLISRSPEEASFTHRDSYLEALGIERLYVALTHANDSPYHLVHLFHALGKAALETNLLSEGSSSVSAVDPLPKLTPRQPHGSVDDAIVISSDSDSMIDADPFLRLRSKRLEDLDEDVEFDHDNEATSEDRDNIVIDEDVDHSTEDDTHAVPSHTPVISTNHGIIGDLERLFSDVDVEGKRKRVESGAASPPKVRNHWMSSLPKF
jgi:hypothetical protein